MPTLVLADLHGNLPALEAVLAHPAARTCTDVVSLGDHVNFGPESRAVHERLISLGAVMLLGNHEERLLRPDDAAFDGYNWRLMRWTAAQLQGADLRLPTDLRRGSILFTHGTPGNPYHLVQPPELPAVLDALPDGISLLLSGHNHRRWDVSHQGKRAVNSGSTGMAETGEGCVAPFLVLDGESLTLHEARYDIHDVLRAFIAAGACRIAPEMCRIVAHVMATGEYQGVTKLIRYVSTFADTMDMTLGHEAAWKAADQTYPWAEPLNSVEYWKQMEKIL